MRCLPAEDRGAFDPAAAGSRGVDGPLDLSGTQASDAVIGDDYSNIDDAAAHQRTSGSGADPSQAGSVHVDSMAKAIKAQIPKGPMAYNAALCEETPGPSSDDPGNLDEVAALRGNQNIRQPPATSGHSGSTAASGSTFEESGRLVTPSAPADDPAEIKHIVREETGGITDS
jgi:hypothetical protein